MCIETTSRDAFQGSDSNVMASASGRRISGRASRRRIRLGTRDESEVPTSLTFGVQSYLLHASSLPTVMHRAAAAFSDSASFSQPYTLSEEVTSIDVFISHNWAVARAKKFFCLALQFNLEMAIASVFATMVFAAAAGSLGVRVLTYGPRPILDDLSLGTYQPCCNARLFIGPVFLCVGIFGQELKYLMGLRGCMVFLDKTCINQDDEEQQWQAVLKLGAFLRSSSRMLALYTDLYLTKLWTVYEIACFLALHPPTGLIVVPMHQPIVVFGGAAILYASSLVFVALTSFGGPAGLTIPSVFFVGGLGCMTVLRLWAREKEAIQQRMAHFQVERCTCLNEADRPIVHKNIAALMRATGDIDEAATERDALAAFNGVMHSDLPRALIASVGPIGLRYRQSVALVLCTGWAGDIVDICFLGVVSSEEEWVLRWRVCEAVYLATQVFGLIPLVFALLTKWSGCCLQFKGCAQILFVVAGLVVILAFFAVMRSLHLGLTWAAVHPGPDRDGFAAALLILLPLSTMLAIRAHSRERRARGETNESGEDFE